jgi:PAS domain S-box-containing protein
MKTVHKDLLAYGLNHVAEALYFSDANGNIININDSACKMLGYTRKELLKMKISDIDTEMTDEEYKKRFKEIKSKKYINFIHKQKRKNGKIIPVEVTAKYFRQGSEEYLFAFTKDITKQLEIEGKLMDNEIKYQNFIEQTYEGISYMEFTKPIDITIPPDKQIKLFYKYGYISECNLAFAKMYGFSLQSEIIGKKLIEIHKTDDIPENVESFRKLIKNDYKILNIETFEIDKNGNNIYLLNNSIGVIRDGYLYGLWGAQINITEKKKEEIRRDAIYKISEAVHRVDNLDELFKSIHQIIGKLMHAKNFYIALYDETSNLIRFPYFIDEYDEYKGYKKLEKGLTEYVLKTGEALLATPEKFRELVNSGEVTLIGKDSVDWLGVPLKKGNITYGILVVQSYTEGIRYTEEDKEILSFVSEQIALAIDKKYSEDAIKISEAKYRNFIEGSLEGVYFLQYDEPIDTKLDKNKQIRLLYETGYINECNDLFARMYGYSRKEDMIGHRIKVLYGDTLNEENRNSLLRFIKGGYKEQNLETREIDAFGNEKYFINNVLGIVKDGYLIANWGTQIEITERKKAEKENQYYKELFSSVAKAEEYLLVEKEFPVAVLKSLKETGRALDVDRVYIFENITEIDTEKILMSLKFEWCSDFTVPQLEIKEFSEIPYDKFSSIWLDELLKGKMISGLIKDFPEPERSFLKSQNVKSMFIVPIFIDDSLWGFIGVDDCRKNRILSETEISVLKTLTLAIGGSIRKKQYEDSLKSNEMKLRTAFSAIPDILFIYSRDGTFIDYYTSREDLLYLKPEEFLGKNIKNLLPPEIADVFIKKINESFIDGKSKSIEYPLKIANEIKYFEARLSTFNGDKVLSIVRDITDMKMIMKELISAKVYAEEMNKVKTNFLANMSHELRTPLHGILGFAQVLMDALDNDQFREIAGTIFKSGNRLMETLNLILNLSKLEAEKISVNITEVRIDDVVIEVYKLFDVVAKEKKIYLKRRMHKENITARIDEKLLRDTLNNIVNNAVKFTKAGGVIIDTDVKNKDLFITIKDTGIGIPKSKQEIIFSEFRQESEGLSRSFEGTGLGLTISKKYTKLLGGEILLESDAGVGSVFTLFFPGVVSGFNIPKSKDDSKSKAKPEDTLKINKILLVENEVVSAELVKLYLKNIYEVDIANDGFEALSKVKSRKYDVILMDINLGEGITGLEATKKIRKLGEYKKTPIIAVTAFAMEGDREEFLQAGCTHYISKPFEKKDLISLLKNL